METLLWRRLRKIKDFDFFYGGFGAVSADGNDAEPAHSAGHKLDSLMVSSVEWRDMQDKENLRVVARETVRYRVIGIHNPGALSEKSLQILEEVSAPNSQHLAKDKIFPLLCKCLKCYRILHLSRFTHSMPSGSDHTQRQRSNLASSLEHAGILRHNRYPYSTQTMLIFFLCRKIGKR